MEKFKKYIYPALMIFFAVIFLVSAGFLTDYFIKSQKQKKQNDELASLVEQLQQEMVTPTVGDGEPDPSGNAGEGNSVPLTPFVKVDNPTTGESMEVLREYAPLFKMNTDTVGWIKIADTKINYPVLQTPKHANYYLKKDFYKEYSRHGSVYAYESANINAPSQNITLFGHNMSDGSMFAGLHKYNDKSFYDTQSFISFDTLSSRGTYKIFAVFYTTDFVDTGFAYHHFVDGTEEDFNTFVATCKELSLYDTGETAVYGDKLLTLSTCDSDFADSHGRFVVVAKKIP